MSTDSQSELGSSATLTQPLGRDVWTVLRCVGGLSIGAGIALTGGISGLALAPLAVGIAIGFVTPVALVGCLLLVGVTEPTSMVPLLPAGGGLFVLAIAGLNGAGNPLQGVAVLSVVTALLIAIAGIAWTAWPPWLAAVGLLVMIATGGYATHRYERVMLGLVTDSDDTEAER